MLQRCHPFLFEFLCASGQSGRTSICTFGPRAVLPGLLFYRKVQSFFGEKKIPPELLVFHICVIPCWVFPHDQFFLWIRRILDFSYFSFLIRFQVMTFKSCAARENKTKIVPSCAQDITGLNFLTFRLPFVYQCQCESKVFFRPLWTFKWKLNS